MPKFKITDDQGQVHRVEAPDAESAKQIFLKGPAPAPKPKGDPILGPPFLNPPQGETAISAPKPESKLGPEPLGEPGSNVLGRIMETVGTFMPGPATGAAAAAGAIPFKGGRVMQLGKRLVTGAGLGAAAEGAGNVVKGEGAEGFLSGLLPGAIFGGAGGAVAGATKAPLQPNKATQRATQGAQALLQAEEWSPNVRSLINEKDPASLYSRETLRRMQGNASKNIRNTLDALDQQFPEGVTIQRDMLDPKTKQSLGLKYPEKITIKEAQKQIADLRKIGSDAEALKLERELVDALGPQAGQYQQTMAQYARDARLIDYVTGVQKRVKLPGGVNPQDFPGAAKAERSLGGGGGDSAAYHAGMFLAHPGSPYGVAHGVGALGSLLGGGQAVDPSRIRPTGPLRQAAGAVVPPVAGASAAEMLRRLLVPQEPSAE